MKKHNYCKLIMPHSNRICYISSMKGMQTAVSGMKTNMTSQETAVAEHKRVSSLGLNKPH